MNTDGLFQNSSFILLIISRLISRIGTQIQSFALGLYILNISGSTVLFASVLAVAAIPNLILGPFIGVFVDRLDKKKILVISELLSSIVIIYFITSFISKGELYIYEIYGIVIIHSIITMFFNPTVQASIPNIVNKDNLLSANKMNSFIISICFVIGPVISGVLFNSFGILFILILNSLSFLVSFLLILFIGIDRGELQDKRNHKKGFLIQLVEGISFTINNVNMKKLMILSLIFNSVVNPTFSIGLIIISKKILNLNEDLVGLIQTIITSSLIIGTLTLNKNKIQDRLWLFINKKMVFVTASFLLLPVILWTYEMNYLQDIYVYIFLTALGFIAMLNMVQMNLCMITVFQLTVPKEMLGRVYTLYNSIISIATPIGQFMLGFMFEKIAITYIFSICFIVMGVCTKLIFSKKERTKKTSNELIGEKA